MIDIKRLMLIIIKIKYIILIIKGIKIVEVRKSIVLQIFYELLIEFKNCLKSE